MRPSGFPFDGESIPRIFWRVVDSPWTGCPHAACIHDWYCRRLADVTDAEAYRRGRRDADRLYREVLEVCRQIGNFDGWLRVRYAGVRIGAWADYMARVRRRLGETDNVPS